MKTNNINSESLIDNFELIHKILKKYYPRNEKIRAELYTKWLKMFCNIEKKPESKLVYVDIQKGYKKSKRVYRSLINNPGYLESFDNRCRIYDTSNSFHYTSWFNPHNYWEKKSIKKLMVDEEIEKHFGYLRFEDRIPLDMKKELDKYFSKQDHIVLVGGYKEKCLKEVYDTFKTLGYKDVSIDTRYVY